MSETVVVDASLALKWVIEEPYSDEARALLEEWDKNATTLLAPHLFVCEVCNALHKRVLRGQISLDDAQLALSALCESGPAITDPPHVAGRALQLAKDLARPTTYDAQYLALAEVFGATFWTADEKLWNAVRDRLPWVRWVGERRP